MNLVNKKQVNRNQQTKHMARTITNNANLPTPLYRALAADNYVGGGDISITKLIAPPRITSLRKKHEDEITEDATDRVWSLLGSAVHHVLEMSAPEGSDVEQRLFMPIEGLPGSVWQLSGQQDLLEDGILYDYKVTSVWSFMFGDKPEWTAQVNLQAMLQRHQGKEVIAGNIVAILRDWMMRKSQVEKDYPQLNVHVISLPMWSDAEIMAYAKKRMTLHQQAWKDFSSTEFDANSLPLCTPEERWYRGGKFAVVKDGNKKADRLFDTKEEADSYIVSEQPRLTKGRKFAPVVERPGENVRCMNYCDVAKFCPFYQGLLKESQETKE